MSHVDVPRLHSSCANPVNDGSIPSTSVLYASHWTPSDMFLQFKSHRALGPEAPPCHCIACFDNALQRAEHAKRARHQKRNYVSTFKSLMACACKHAFRVLCTPHAIKPVSMMGMQLTAARASYHEGLSPSIELACRQSSHDRPPIELQLEWMAPRASLFEG